MGLLSKDEINDVIYYTYFAAIIPYNVDDYNVSTNYDNLKLLCNDRCNKKCNEYNEAIAYGRIHPLILKFIFIHNFLYMYYAALKDSQIGLYKNKEDVTPYVRYMLSTIM